MKFYKKPLAVITVLVFLVSISVISFRAGVLYSEGAYTFEEIDSDYVSLYAYDNSSETLVIPAMYNNTHYVSDISDYAFDGNTIISSIDFSKTNRLTSIGVKSFNACSNLSGTLTIPRSVRSIGLGAFEKCTALETVNINASIKEIPVQCFNRCELLSEVTLPINAERIENLAFANCGNLRNVYFPTTITYISESAFLDSGSVRFHVWYGSYAHQYAIDNHIPYTLFDNALLGDANGDGYANINDVTTIQRYKADMETLEGINFHAADVNGDGNVTIEDATILQRFFAEYDDIKYPIGKVITQ